MDFNIKEGLNAIIEKVVTENETARKYGSGMMDVYATPAMIALMENTAKNSVDTHLPEGYTTVGIEINVKHIKATPVGMKVKCEAKLQEIQGKKIFFQIEAYDEKGKIGEAYHVRYVVNTEEFMEKIQN